MTEDYRVGANTADGRKIDVGRFDNYKAALAALRETFDSRPEIMSIVLTKRDPHGWLSTCQESR